MSSQPTPCEPDARGAAPAEEVRVRAGGRVDDGVRAVDELELRRRPSPIALRPRAGCSRPRAARVSASPAVDDVEVELDHLPVALVQVVPVVEDVEHPVLERELAGVAGVGHDVRVHRRLVTLRDAPRPLSIVAARLERVAREVEVILVEAGARGRSRPARPSRGCRPPTARAARPSAPRTAE